MARGRIAARILAATILVCGRWESGAEAVALLRSQRHQRESAGAGATASGSWQSQSDRGASDSGSQSSFLDQDGLTPQGASDLAPQGQGGSCSAPSLLDVLGRFPEPRAPLAPRPLLARAAPPRVAMCMVGHIRTFALPGVYSGIVQNVMNTMRERHGSVDLFFVGHLGSGEGASGNLGHHTVASQQDGGDIVSEKDERLRGALEFPGLHLKYKEVHQDGSADTFRRLSRMGEVQCESQQFKWVDRCVQKVLQDPEPYDLIIVSRPDVGVFAPMPWGNISKTRVNHMRRNYGSGEDWFFTMPMVAVDAYWNHVRKLFAARPKFLNVDRVIFPEHDSDKSAAAEVFRPLLEPLQFPAVIVRNSTSAECNRLEPMKEFFDTRPGRKRKGQPAQPAVAPLPGACPHPGPGQSPFGCGPYLKICKKLTSEGYWSSLHV